MNVTGSLILTTKSEILDLLFLKGFSSGGSFALWRKPKTSHLEFLMDHEQNPSKVDLAFEELPAGFIVHPFADQADKKAFLSKQTSISAFTLTKIWTRKNYLNGLQIQMRMLLIPLNLPLKKIINSKVPCSSLGKWQCR